MSGLCAAIKQVAHVWPATEPTPAPETLTPAVDVAALCHEMGWPVVERDGGVLIELDVPQGFAQARVAAGPDGSIATAVFIGDGPPPSPCRDALALLLLRASGSVRLVRAAAKATPGLEVALPPPVTVPALQHAFCALSVAYRLVVREAAALAHDASLAATYLRHGPAPISATGSARE
jgi:hypothetical protein